MSALLPPPGSVWRQRSTHRQMRVIYSAEFDIVAHDAELADKLPTHIEISSWVGDAAAFEKEFIPGDPELYPLTAA